MTQPVDPAASSPSRLPPAARTARIDAENTPSARLAERIGMRREAHLVENEWFTGRWADEYDYAILAREWTARG